MDTPDSTTLKHCSKCGEDKPSTAEFFHRNKNLADGFNRWCKVCCSKASKRWYENNRDHVKAMTKAWQQTNRERRNETSRLWREANKEARREYYSAYRQTNREKLLDQRKARYKANPELFRAGKHRRFARKRLLPGTFTAEDWRFAVEYFGGCCAVCRRPVGLWHTLAADHWIPLKSPDCPGTVAWNIVPLCHGEGGCNNFKYDRMPADWLVERFGKRKGRVILKRIEAFLNSRRSAS